MHSTVSTRRTVCLAEQESLANKQTPYRPQSFCRDSCTIKGEGLHGNSLIIFWGPLSQHEITGLPQPAEGQSCLYTLPSVGAFLHSQEPGREEAERTELPTQEAPLGGFTVSSLGWPRGSPLLASGGVGLFLRQDLGYDRLISNSLCS